MAQAFQLERTLTLQLIKSDRKKIISIFNLPAIVILGKSNVGKSSLLNSLLNQKAARKGKKPGLTSFIQIFKINLNNYQPFFLVDCPGYGYAHGGEKRKKSLIALISAFLDTVNKKISCSLFLLDIRRALDEKPNTHKLPENHQSMDLHWLTKLSELKIPTIIVATKADKLSKNNRSQALKVIASKYGIEPNDIFLVSSEKNIGILDLLYFIKDRFLIKKQ